MLCMNWHELWYDVNWYMNDDWSGISIWEIVPDGEEKCEIVGLSRADSPTDCEIWNWAGRIVPVVVTCKKDEMWDGQAEPGV